MAKREDKKPPVGEQPSKETWEEAGVHSRREATTEGEARRGVEGEPLSESDREAEEEKSTPASEPAD